MNADNETAPAGKGEGCLPNETAPSSSIVPACCDEVAEREARVDALVAKVERSLDRARIWETVAVGEALVLLIFLALVAVIAR